MKTIRSLSLILFSLLFLFNTNDVFSQEKKEKNQETVIFYVENMHCKNCQATIEKYIPFEKGVKDLKCDLENKLVTVIYDSKKTNPEKLQKGFEKIKFPVVIAPVEEESDNNSKE